MLVLLLHKHEYKYELLNLLLWLVNTYYCKTQLLFGKIMQYS